MCLGEEGERGLADSVCKHLFAFGREENGTVAGLRKWEHRECIFFLQDTEIAT